MAAPSLASIEIFGAKPTLLQNASTMGRKICQRSRSPMKVSPSRFSAR
jgi:hypothetical protein